MTRLAVALWLLVASESCGQDHVRLPTPADATGWALADIATAAEIDRPFLRYLWIPPWGDEKWVAAIGFAVNSSPSHARTIQQAAVVANGWMLRYDLRRLAPQPQQLEKLLATWDGLAKDDPYFHVPRENTNLGVAVIAPHLPQDQAAALVGLSLSTGAVYRADWFIAKSLSTLDGGRYYDFRQVNKRPDKGTPLDNWLSSRGLFVGSTQQAGGERRAAMFRSGVTGKPRRVDIFPTLSGGIGSITRDVKDGNVGADSHPIRNLLKFRDDGSEIIVALPNGMLDYLLADAAGNIVDEAPPDLVRDHTIPAPHTSRLQPARSCISCHGTSEADGWQPVTNDVARLLGSRLNVFADVSRDLTPEQVADQLAGLYALDVDSADSLLGRGRRDHATAMFRVAQGVQFPGKSIVADVAQLTTSIIHRYEYDLVTPAIAARELGVVLAKDSKADPLEVAIGPASAADIVDPVAGFLRIGVAVNRRDFEIIYGDLASVAESKRGAK